MTKLDILDLLDYMEEDLGTEVFDPDFDGTEEEDFLDPEYLPSWER